jgi:hypothetical protein
VLLPAICLAARRLHDIGKSGWWQLVLFIPFLGFLLLLYWLVQPTGTEANQFGQPTASTDQGEGGVPPTTLEKVQESSAPLAEDNSRL